MHFPCEKAGALDWSYLVLPAPIISSSISSLLTPWTLSSAADPTRSLEFDAEFSLSLLYLYTSATYDFIALCSILLGLVGVSLFGVPFMPSLVAVAVVRIRRTCKTATSLHPIRLTESIIPM